MKALQRRVEALDHGGGCLTIGDVLDCLDGGEAPAGRVVDPALKAALAAMEDA
ncbi:MAG: hypothetical protein KKE77_13265 [Alphaproteobacteria bacterium]|nr:hypothetical protein [Alphaproteobacteria bacterium]